MSDPYIDAAQTLILKLGLPAQFHSVYIRTGVDPDTKEFKKSIAVSIRPPHQSKVNIPDSHNGIPVVQVPWPKGV